MLLTKTIRIPQSLLQELEEMAVHRDIASATLIRDILLEYLGHKPSTFTDIQEHLKFNINLSIKTLYLVKFLADGIDRETTEEILSQAEDFIKKSGLNNSVQTSEVDHG